MKPLLAILCSFLPMCAVNGNNNHVETHVKADINVSLVPPTDQILTRP